MRDFCGWLWRICHRGWSSAWTFRVHPERREEPVIKEKPSDLLIPDLLFKLPEAASRPVAAKRSGLRRPEEITLRVSRARLSRPQIPVRRPPRGTRCELADIALRFRDLRQPEMHARRPIAHAQQRLELRLRHVEQLRAHRQAREPRPRLRIGRVGANRRARTRPIASLRPAAALVDLRPHRSGCRRCPARCAPPHQPSAARGRHRPASGMRAPPRAPARRCAG